MDFKHYYFISEQLNISEQEIFQLLKMEDGHGFDHLHYIARSIFEDYLHAKPMARGGYAVFEKESLDIREGIIKINNIEIKAGSQICGYLKEAQYFALFICTAGEYFTELTRKYNDSGDLLEAFIIDLIGSLAAEKAMDAIQTNMEIEYKAKNLNISQRYSPGYCNWALSNQQELFSLLPENNCGISLTASSLMIPIKSVSGIIGIGEKLKKSDYGCEICNNQTCVYRQVRMKGKN